MPQRFTRITSKKRLGESAGGKSRKVKLQGVVATGLAAGLALTVGGPAAAWPGGDVIPTALISGDVSGLRGPVATAHDASGNLYVANSVTNSVTVYAPGATGNSAPVKTLAGAATNLAVPSGLAVDTAGVLYVSNTGTNTVTAYASGWTMPETPPSKTLTYAAGVDGPAAVAVDTASNLYVANAGSDTVTMYNAGWSDGTVAPTKTLQGTDTLIAQPSALATDDADNLYVANAATGTISMFAAGWLSGESDPSRSLAGTSNPTGLTIDGAGNLYVAESGTDAVNMYASSWTSLTTGPEKSLAGANTSLSAPAGLSVNALGELFVANAGADSVATFGPANTAQTIQFPQIPKTSTAEPSPSAAATASSGLPVTYSTMTPEICTTNGSSLISLSAVGECTIQASQSGDGTYYPATPVEQTFSVTDEPVIRDRQVPAKKCIRVPQVMSPKKPKTLMKPHCKTKAGMTIGVLVKSRNGKKKDRTVRVHCAVGKKNKKRTAAVLMPGQPAYYCPAGKLRIPKIKSSLSVGIRWSAAATKTKDSLEITKYYRPIRK